MFSFTNEPPNKGEVGTSTDVHYSEVVFYCSCAARVSLVNPQCACSARVTVVGSVYVCLSVCLLSHISPTDRMFVLKTLSRTQRVRKVKKFVGICLK